MTNVRISPPSKKNLQDRSKREEINRSGEKDKSNLTDYEGPLSRLAER